MLPTDKQQRKETPMARGLLDYFPDALAAVANVSFVGNKQHNPSETMHWAREKSTDHADCVIRHMTERGKTDEDGLRHTAKAAWRILALLQLELEHASQNRQGVEKGYPTGTHIYGSPVAPTPHPDIFNVCSDAGAPTPALAGEGKRQPHAIRYYKWNPSHIPNCNYLFRRFPNDSMHVKIEGVWRKCCSWESENAAQMDPCDEYGKRLK